MREKKVTSGLRGNGRNPKPAGFPCQAGAEFKPDQTHSSSGHSLLETYWSQVHWLQTGFTSPSSTFGQSSVPIASTAENLLSLPLFHPAFILSCLSLPASHRAHPNLSLIGRVFRQVKLLGKTYLEHEFFFLLLLSFSSVKYPLHPCLREQLPDAGKHRENHCRGTELRQFAECKSTVSTEILNWTQTICRMQIYSLNWNFRAIWVRLL